MGECCKAKNVLIFCPSLLACTLYKAVEVNLVLVLGITSLTTPFFSGPPLSPGLRLGQWMRVVGLCSCSVQMNHGLWEGWWKDCTLPHGFVRLGLPFLTTHISTTEPRLLQARPTWLAPTVGSRRPFRALEVLFVYATLCPPCQEWILLEMWHWMCGKSTSWTDARVHPHSHTTPILTRHQVDHFQEIWHFVSLFFK